MKILYKIKILTNYLLTKYDKFIIKNSDLEKFQERKLKKHFKYVMQNSKFYNKNIKIKNPKLEDFPIINKKILMDNLEEICTVNIKKDKAFELAINSEKTRNFSDDYKNLSLALSSGTSGNRSLVITNDYDKTLWTGRILAKLLPNGIFHKEKIAFFLRANNNLYESLNSKFISFKYFDLMNEMNNNLEELEKFNPSIISAPASVLMIIADKFKNKKIKLNPKMIISVAEVLYENDEKFMEKIFGQKIHQIYQASEGFLGHTCKYGNLHLNEDIIKVEKNYIDKEKNRFIPIITDFRRRTQPIIRYRLNDILIENTEKCPCGSKFSRLEKIEGREDDVFLFSNEKENIFLFPDFISRAIIFADEEILDYYVSQEKINDIKVFLNIEKNTKEKEIKEKIIKNLENLKENYKIPVMNISFSDNYFLEIGKKKKRIERLF